MILRPSSRPSGFSLVEVLIVMVLTGVVVAGTLQALSAQKKFYARQGRILDARHAMRASTIILTSELREASAAGGDLYAIGSDSLALRSTVGFGVVCQVDESGGTLSLRYASGHFRLETADSVLVFVENGRRYDDDSWRALALLGIAPGGSACADGGASDRVISVPGPLNGIWVGAPVRLFRPYVFRIFELDERWWLGRRNRGAGPGYLPVAGPLAPPGDGGLELLYFRGDGAATTDPSLVARVQIGVRAPAHRSLTDPDYRELGTSAHLRNNG